MIVRACLFALLVAGASSSVANADRVHVNATACAILGPEVLEDAVDHELALDPRLAAIAQRISVVVECPDDASARLRIEPEPSDGPLIRQVDLREEPSELRIKLVALAIAELIDVLAVPPHERPSPVPRPLIAVTDSEEAPRPPGITQTSAADRGPKISLRAGIRIFADDQNAMPSLTGEIDLGPVALGLTTAIGSGNRFAGIPYVVAVTASRRLVCSHGRTTLCMIARGELGFSGVSIEPDPAIMMEHSVHSGYGSVAVGFEIARRFAGWGALAGIELGGADGLVVEARYLEHLDGPFTVIGAGVQW